MSSNNINSPIDPQGGYPTNGVIRTYSDSQQSLDKLFNNQNSEATIPLRNRNLPASFFDPLWQLRRDGGPLGQQQRRNPVLLHSRSTSFEPGRNQPPRLHNTIHMRTQSTLAPMTGLVGSAIGSTNSVNSIQNALTEETTISSGPGHAIFPAQYQPQLPTPVTPDQTAQTKPPVPQPRNHFRHYSSPIFVNDNNNIPVSQTNHFYATPSLNNQMESQTSDCEAPVSYYCAAAAPVERTMTETSYDQPAPVPAYYQAQQATAAQNYYPAEQSHTGTQSTLTLATGLSESAASSTNSIHTASTCGNSTTNWTQLTSPCAQQPVLAAPIATDQQGQTMQPVPLPRSNHYRNFSPSFAENNDNITVSQASHFYAVPTLNTSMDSQNVDVKPHNLYYDMETVPPDSTMTDTNYTLNSAWLAG